MNLSLLNVQLIFRKGLAREKKTIKMGLASSEKDNAVQNFNQKFLLKILFSAFVLKSVQEEQHFV